MSILTNNPGYIAAAAYDADPSNVDTPNPFHNEYDQGLNSYILAVGTPVPFAQDVNGVVNGPTSADIAAGRLLDANNAWIDPPGGLTQDGDGTFTVTAAIGAMAGGLAKDAGSTFVSSGEGSVNLGQVSGSGTATCDDDGSFFVGYCEGGQVTSTGDGSGIIGYCGPTNTMAATSVGSIILGAATSSSSQISVTGQGALGGGLASGGNDITSAFNGGFQWGPGATDAVGQFNIGGGTLRINFLSGSEAVGLFGATPVAQPNGTGETVGFTAGAGTGVNDDSTFTGNVGATAYRISDIVKALKNLGAIAA